jgi:hypothetical protein
VPEVLNNDHLKASVTARIDESIKRYFENIKHTWKKENDIEKGKKEKERLIQNKCDQHVRTVCT